MVRDISWAKMKRAAAIRRAAPKLLEICREILVAHDERVLNASNKKSVKVVLKKCEKIISKIDQWGG
jgi:hypothetical protein